MSHPNNGTLNSEKSDLDYRKNDSHLEQEGLPDPSKEAYLLNSEESSAGTEKHKGRLAKFRQSVFINVLFSVLVPLITIVTLEWIARGTFAANKQNNGFFQAIIRHFPSFLIAFLLLACIYVFISQLTGLHALATPVVGMIGNMPAVITYYKLTMRGEPFLPWDLSQVEDLMGVSDSVEFSIQTSMIVTIILFILLTILAGFIKLPPGKKSAKNRKARIITSSIALVTSLALVFGIFLSPKGTLMVGIKSDMWMQDRYYRTNGVLTGFLTNLQLLDINVPKGYNKESVMEITDETILNSKDWQPYYAGSPAMVQENLPERPNIIYLMAESFWDVTKLEGITYDRDLLPNLNRLSEEGGSGWLYTPSFGGGTCDVEFEALTGFSVENLPAGSKPFQQYVTDEMFSFPHYLKDKGYSTQGIHGYGRKFWNRDQAYPRLGIDEFIASDDFVNPVKRRGFISDEAMVDRIIEEYDEAVATGNPAFIHAVTMQNHTTYSRDRYPASDLVKVTDHPAKIPDGTIGQLEDCATGIFEMDAALGRLTDYLSTSSEPTIVVFWGDHLNPMSDGYAMFEETGFIGKGETSDPMLHKTPLLIWSNYSTQKVDLGVQAAYNLSPVVMDLYGLDKPVYFSYLSQQWDTLRARTRGVTVNPDGTTSLEMTEAQQEAVNKQAILQYDYMFGNEWLDEYLAVKQDTETPVAGGS